MATFDGAPTNAFFGHKWRATYEKTNKFIINMFKMNNELTELTTELK